MTKWHTGEKDKTGCGVECLNSPIFLSKPLRTKYLSLIRCQNLDFELRFDIGRYLALGGPILPLQSGRNVKWNGLPSANKPTRDTFNGQA